MRIWCSVIGVTLAGLSFALPARGALTHRYSFNDGTANDSVGGANGVVVNGPSVINGQVVFDPAVNNGTNVDTATGQYVDLPNGLAKTRALTYELWFTYRGGAAWQRVLDFGDSTAGELPPSDTTTSTYDGHGYTIIVPQSSAGYLLGQITVVKPDGSTTTNYTPTTRVLSTNAEHHVVLTHDLDAKSERIYLDGAFVLSVTASADPSQADYTNFWLGRSNYHKDPFFNGSINELRIYDHALSAAEVASSFAAGPDAALPEPSAGAASILVATGAGLLRCRRRI